MHKKSNSNLRGSSFHFRHQTLKKINKKLSSKLMPSEFEHFAGILQ